MQDNNDLFRRPDDENEKFKTKIFDKNIDEIIDELNKSTADGNTLFNITASDEKEEKSEEDAVKKPKKQRKGIPTFVRILIIFIISVLLALTIILAAIDFLGITFSKKEVVCIEIKSGYSTAQIADELKEKGVIKFPLLYRLYSKLTHADGTYQFGLYEMNDDLGYSGVINTLQQPGYSGGVATVTIPEGYSIEQIATLLEDKGVCSYAEFINVVKTGEFDYEFIKNIPTEKVVYRLEGYLYPDTYDLFKNTDGESGEDCAYKAIQKMLYRMSLVLTDDVVAKAENKGYTIHEVLTMASILELEANSNPDEMPKVAQVFYNRLRWTDQPNYIGSTPTADYPKSNPNSRYNTNTGYTKGLPPGPYCGPSENAINAALNPDTSVTENYFVTDKNMKFYYTASLDEHNALIEKLKSEGLWN